MNFPSFLALYLDLMDGLDGCLQKNLNREWLFLWCREVVSNLHRAQDMAKFGSLSPSGAWHWGCFQWLRKEMVSGAKDLIRPLADGLCWVVAIVAIACRLGYDVWREPLAWTCLLTSRLDIHTFRIILPFEHRGLTDQVKTMIRASSAGVSHWTFAGLCTTPEATNHQQLLLSHCQRYQKNARISANTTVHSHAIAAWWCLRGTGIAEKTELLQNAGYLAFWVRLRLCDF